MEIRALQEGDDRSRFRSGDPDLDRFFSRFAGQNQFRHYVGVTYVAVEGSLIAGFATVAAGQMEVDGLPPAQRRGLPAYPLPVLRLARLAVDDTVRGRGIGAELLRYVLGLALRRSRDVGCVGVVVDAKPPAVAFYAKYGFGKIEAVEGGSAARPEPALMFLALSAVKAVLEE